MAREYRRSALVIVPSMWSESFGRTVVEAFSHGRGVIATAVGGLPDTVDSNVGHLVAADDGGLRDALRWLDSLSADGAQRLGAAAATVYNALYTPRRHAQELLRVYELVATSAGPP
jgi:glycosyltransferase involved in cell wall biosynthesis